MSYKFTLEGEAFEFFLAQRLDRRRKILAWIETLKASPFTAGGQTIVDEVGREIQVCAIQGFLVYHWAEHLVETIHIVRIEKA